MALSRIELDELLDRTHPALLGTIATLRADGSPHVMQNVSQRHEFRPPRSGSR